MVVVGAARIAVVVTVIVVAAVRAARAVVVLGFGCGRGHAGAYAVRDAFY